MDKKTRTTESAEELVRNVLEKSFNQKVDPETLHSAAKKVSSVVDEVSRPRVA